MDAFVEVLSGVVRFGEHCHKFGDPYEGAVAFSANKGFATLKGLAIERKLTRADYNAVFRACRELGLEPIYERMRTI